jgi:hypothetical protein
MELFPNEFREFDFRSDILILTGNNCCPVEYQIPKTSIVYIRKGRYFPTIALLLVSLVASIITFTSYPKVVPLVMINVAFHMYLFRFIPYKITISTKSSTFIGYSPTRGFATLTSWYTGYSSSMD